MELLGRKFTSQSVALATGVDQKSIQNWTTRGMIIGQRGDNAGRGAAVKFSWFNVMEVAIAAELMGVGFSSVADAFNAAQKFAHTGTGPALWEGDEASGPNRHPSLPWHHSHGQTGLFVWKGGSAVMLLPDDGKVNLRRITPPGNRGGFVFVNVSEVFNMVCARMALHPFEVLDEAYSEDAKG